MLKLNYTSIYLYSFKKSLITLQAAGTQVPFDDFGTAWFSFDNFCSSLISNAGLTNNYKNK